MPDDQPVSGGGPHRQPVLVCVAFLLFTTADAFSLPFLPLYAGELFRPGGIIPLDLSQGLPITSFWLAVAAAQISTGRWERGRNRRTLFISATAVAAAGLMVAAAAPDVNWLVVSRVISGFGYGMMLILAQDYLLKSFGIQARTFASGLYIGLFFGGYLLGALIGGILAGHVGFANTLWIAAEVTVVAGLSFLRLASCAEPLPPEVLRSRELMRNGLLSALVLFAAIPSRIVNGGFLYLLAPLYLHEAGAGQADIGMVIMVFSLIMAVTSVPWARLVDRTGRPLLFTIIGMGITGLSMLPVPFGLAGVWGIIVAMMLLGTGQAIGMSPQVTVLFRIAAPEIARFGQTGILGFYRVCERVGLIVGPILVAWLIGQVGYTVTLSMLGAMMAVSAVALAAVFALHRPPP